MGYYTIQGHRTSPMSVPIESRMRLPNRHPKLSQISAQILDKKQSLCVCEPPKGDLGDCTLFILGSLESSYWTILLVLVLEYSYWTIRVN